MAHQWSFRRSRMARPAQRSKFVALRGVALVRTLLLLPSCIVAATAFASAGGRSGFSGDPSTNSGAPCSVCHAPDGATPPSVSIVGPDRISAGTTQQFSVVIAGGPAQTGGVDISAHNRIGDLLPNNGELYLLDGELTHTGPKNFSGNQVAFTFLYKAPNYNTQVTLHAAGNSTNGALNLLGDGISTTSHQITIENGFEPPPEPPPSVTSAMSAILFASGFTEPVAIDNAGDERLFVVERRGVIKIVGSDGTVLPTPFLDIQERVDDSGGEMGLLGIAFHPDYANNGYFYVNYIYDHPVGVLDRTRVSRFKVTSNPNVADPNSEQVVMAFEQPYANHNGGDLHFDTFGYLNIAAGDGGSGGDPQNRSQATTTMLGKILRIDVDTPPGPGTGPDCNITLGTHYSIPASNAFTDGKGGAGCDEIFVLGVRNPWRFAIDHATGAMWIADVGQNLYEEVNYLSPGVSGGINLGWRCYEGTEPYNLANCNRVYLPPVYTYSHATSGCSITGGRVYRGQRSPHLRGQYFFSDICQSSIRALSGPPGDLSHRIVLPSGTLSTVSTFGEDFMGEPYVAELATGNIYRLESTLPPGC